MIKAGILLIYMYVCMYVSCKHGEQKNIQSQAQQTKII